MDAKPDDDELDRWAVRIAAVALVDYPKLHHDGPLDDECLACPVEVRAAIVARWRAGRS